jgi:hypothetical protein
MRKSRAPDLAEHLIHRRHEFADIPSPTVGSKTYPRYGFSGCKQGYPVKVCTFDGARIANVGDGGTGNVGKDSGIPPEPWKFFTRFRGHCRDRHPAQGCLCARPCRLNLRPRHPSPVERGPAPRDQVRVRMIATGEPPFRMATPLSSPANQRFPPASKPIALYAKGGRSA